MDKTQIDSQLDTLHHYAVTVQNLEQAVKWYTHVFRCEVDYIDETWALLKFANARLALVMPDQHPSHIGVERSDAENWVT